MIVNIKHTNDTKVTIEVDAEDSILQVKEKINEKFPDIPPSQQRLIYSGKILKDEDKVSTYSIKDGNTLHLVKSQKPGSSSTASKPAATPSVASPAAATSATAATTSPSTAASPANLFAGLGGAGLAGAGLGGAGLGGFGGLGGAGMDLNDPNMQNLLQNPGNYFPLNDVSA